MAAVPVDLGRVTWSSDYFGERKWHAAAFFFIAACALGGVSASAFPISAR